MAQIDPKLTTGLSGLDKLLKGLIPGDNIVWQVTHVEGYRPFIPPYVSAAKKLGQKVIYFRFAAHLPLVEPGEGIEIHNLDPTGGFEPFINAIHRVIDANGRGGFYIFDCLSDLARHWYSDQMLGNFFMLTCPYLLDAEALAYFGILRGHHNFHATAPILSTTQILLDVYHHKGQEYIHPWKVQARYSPTMHMLHVLKGEEVIPVTDSITISEIRTAVPWAGLETSSQNVGIWNETFREAEDMIEASQAGAEVSASMKDCFRRLLRMAISRDERVLELLERYMTLDEVLTIGQRVIGSGLIGGKSVGMLLARAILDKDRPDLADKLEAHDSFYIGSDVFYTFMVRNGLWWIRENQKDPQRFLEGAGRGRHRILLGEFPDYVQKQFEDLLDYFGQSPIIVRSSSLLEDNFGNAFAGKYESVFCANQGPRQRRLEDFLSAVRTIYASAMSEEALTYRMQRGLLECDEQMALLVQRVSGAMYDHLFFPHTAGVGFSFNPYVWNENIDPHAGMMRLVFGLGTRAVDRADDDYTRVVALNDPQRRPETNFDEVRKFSQRRVDVLDLKSNQLTSRRFENAARHGKDALPLELFATKDEQIEQRAAQAGVGEVFPYVLTFEELLNNTSFVTDMRETLQTIHTAYNYPVDVEFTANFPHADGEGYRMNIVQCRPLQVCQAGKPIKEAPKIKPADMLVEAHGAVIGPSRSHQVDRVIYIVPEEYGQLGIADRHAVARWIGKVVHLPDAGELSQILFGPGRWGTTTPSLGVPAKFADIDKVKMICEIVAMREDVVPDVSLGTHFFSDMVERDITYFALFPTRDENSLNHEFFQTAPNSLPDLLPKAAEWQHVIKVIDSCNLPQKNCISVHANSIDQQVLVYRHNCP